MKASTRSWGILLTFLFIGLAGYAGYELYQLPISIAENLKKEKDARIREIRMLVLDNKDKRGKNLNDRELLKAIREELTREVKGKESERLTIAQDLAMPTYKAFGVTLVVGITLMFLLLRSSYRTSAETIVYIEKQEEEDESLNQSSEKDTGKLGGLLSELKSNPEAVSSSKEYLEKLLSQVAEKLNMGAGAIYQVKKTEKIRNIELIAGYAFIVSDSERMTYEFGEGLAGQVAKTGTGKLFNSIPEGYVEVFSGLGESTPNYLAILPLIREKEVAGVMELAFLEKISEIDYQHLKTISDLIGNSM
ncbi:MAG: hypothetical protein ACI85I_000266 [Arenicella sp.]|jgi:hypothetical protein